MLPGRGNHMIPRLQKPADGQIQALGGIGREDHLLRFSCSQKPGQAFSCPVNGSSCIQGGLVDTPAGIAHLIQGFYYGFFYAVRLLKGRGCIVKINHGLMSFDAPAMVSAITYMFVTSPTFSFSVRP